MDLASIHRLLASGHRVELLVWRAGDETRARWNRWRETKTEPKMRQYLPNKNFSVTCTYLINKMNKIPILVCRRRRPTSAHIPSRHSLSAYVVRCIQARAEITVWPMQLYSSERIYHPSMWMNSSVSFASMNRTFSCSLVSLHLIFVD